MIRFVYVIFIAAFCWGNVCAQSAAAVQLVEEGIALHDEGNFMGALGKYNDALEMESGDYFLAGAEKATTLFFIENFTDCVDLCEQLIKRYPKEETLSQVYTTLGNSLDLMGKPEEAVDAYERAIGRFPDDYMLHFNLGVTYLRGGNMERGKENLLKGIGIYPRHPGSHYALALVLNAEGKRTPAIFALLNFLCLELGTDRSVQGYAMLDRLLGGSLEKTGRNSVTISLDGSAMAEKDAEDNYFSVDLLLDLRGALENDKKYRKKNKGKNLVEKRTELVEALVESASELYASGSLKGPLTATYLPFFKELMEGGRLEALVYLAHADSGEKFVENWLEAHFGEVKELLDHVFDK